MFDSLKKGIPSLRIVVSVIGLLVFIVLFLKEDFKKMAVVAEKSTLTIPRHTPSDRIRLVALPGKLANGSDVYSEEVRVDLGSYYVAPIIGESGCVRFMINDTVKEPVCPGQVMNFDYKSEKGEVVRIRIHSEEEKPITFEFIPVRRS